MDEINWGMMPVYLLLNFVGGVLTMGSYCVFVGEWDQPARTVLLVIGGTFVVLCIVEFLCWLFHIPAWIDKGLTWIRNKTEPKE